MSVRVGSRCHVAGCNRVLDVDQVKDAWLPSSDLNLQTIDFMPELKGVHLSRDGSSHICGHEFGPHFQTHIPHQLLSAMRCGT
jgi:hypothetical protein